MTISNLLPFLLLVPTLGFISCLVLPKRMERTIFWVSIAIISVEMILLLLAGSLWAIGGFRPAFTHVATLFANEHYTLALEIYFDRLSAIFLTAANALTGLVFIFSKYYMHREPGFKRFFSTLFLFFMGLSLIILAGNFEVLFIGWELIGISSILLIAFYRDRFLPSRNALKVFSVYRVADAFLLVGILFAHHVFAGNFTFSEMGELASRHAADLSAVGLFIIVAALIKSAQYPFSYWLPRAMEGPTTSSAIFYGALSVHMGVFLLLRTYPLWEGSIGLRITVVLVGLATAIIASSITRVQSSIKSQIAYASITQIGIMFIEVAAGLHALALLHFVSNASLRTYQLLISPSVVSYMVHEQFFTFIRPPQRITNTLLGRLRATYYTLSIKEWDMNAVVSGYIWGPLKKVGRAYAFLDHVQVQIGLIALALLGTLLASLATPTARELLAISTASAFVAILSYIRAYTTKRSAITSWNLIMLGHWFGIVFLAAATPWRWTYITMYSSGVVLAYVAGLLCLRYLALRGESLTLWDFHGAVYAHPKLAQIFFITALAFMSFPITPSFLAQDILLSFIHGTHTFQIALFCICYLLSGVGIMRIYAKLFFGPHKSSYHEIAYKSS